MLRSSRFKRNRKKYRKLIVLTQVLLIWYAAVLSLSFLTTGTAAYFSNDNNVYSTISSAEYWWDRSDLVFLSGDAEPILACEPIEVSAPLKNIGLDMYGETEFEVYSLGSNSSIGGGYVAPINSGDIGYISYGVLGEGSYMFEVFQREGYGHDYENRVVIQSDVISVTCPPPPPEEVETDDLDLGEENEVLDQDAEDVNDENGAEGIGNSNDEVDENRAAEDVANIEEGRGEENNPNTPEPQSANDAIGEVEAQVEETAQDGGE